MGAPQFEQIDLEGVTTHFNGTVGTTAIAIPSVAGKAISEFWIQNPGTTNARDRRLLISLDGGVNFRTLPWNSEFAWSIKGQIKQIYIKASAAATAYEAILNIEVD